MIDWKRVEKEWMKAYKEYVMFIVCKYNISAFENIDLDDYCYCDIEKFFDDNGIIINYDKCSDDFDDNWLYNIKFISTSYYIESEYEYNSRDEAKEQAIYKAFEILEQQLEGK